jgi:uncharacterized alpha-E superfamily protein
MLSRVAERMYWGARYLERAENTARLVRVYDAALMDLPEEAGLGWPLLVEICGARELFNARYPKGGDRETLRFLSSDGENTGSIIASLLQARENFRTTRDLCPTEAWRAVNELYLYGRKALPGMTSPRRRHEVLSGVVQRVQQLTGLLSWHHESWRRLPLHAGRAESRARRHDDTHHRRRRGDVARHPRERDPAREHAVDGGSEIAVRLPDVPPVRAPAHSRRGRDPVPLHDPLFPRAVAHCLGEVQASMRELPNHEAPLRAALRVQREVDAQVSRPFGELELAPPDGRSADRTRRGTHGHRRELVPAWPCRVKRFACTCGLGVFFDD